MEYSVNASMSPSTTGTNDEVQVTPGTDLYYRLKATDLQFSSGIKTLDVPARPAIPSFAIDFQSEQTSTVISSSFEYAGSQDMADAISGNSLTLPLVPGSSVYFRQKATDTSFVSGIQSLSVPLRPDAPVISIDFVEENTNEILPPEYEYSVSADISGSQSGDGAELQLTPGQDYYFRVKSTSSAFASGISQLTVPERPLINSMVGDTLTEPSFTAAIDFHGEASGFDAADIIADNAIVKLIDVHKVKIEPVAYGEVSMKVKANAIQEGNFASGELITYFKEVATSTPDVLDSESSILVFPNPASTWLEVEAGRKFALPGEIMLIDVSGNVVIHEKLNSEHITLDIHGVSSGVYILKAVDMKGNIITHKITKQD
jgi:hypothetical protein